MYVYECTCFIPQSVVHGLLGFVQQHLLVLAGHIPCELTHLRNIQLYTVIHKINDYNRININEETHR